MNWNSRSGDLKVNRENGTHARFPAKMFSFFFFVFLSFLLTSGLMVFLWGRNCIHVISEALDGHGRRERERDCYIVAELKPSAQLSSALTQSHNEKS